MAKWFAWGAHNPANEGLSRREIAALEDERVFGKSAIKTRAKDAKRQGKEASAQGFFSFGHKVMHDEERDGKKPWSWW